ncbi:MAG: MFS transporter [Candidatus Kariarchaeaceae archaeon]|jgi:MFS family permease
MSYIVIFGAAILNLIVGILEPTIAPYLEDIGASKSEIGSIISARWLIVAFGSIPFALLASRIGHIKVLFISAISSITAGICLVYIDGTQAVLYFYLAMGVASASASGPGAAILAENLGSKRIAAFSLFTVARMIPPAIGAGISYLWFDTKGKDKLTSTIFPLTMWATIVGMGCYILLLTVNRELDLTSKEGRVPIIRQFRIIFLPIVAVPVLLLITTNFIMGAGAGASLPYLPLYLDSIGASKEELSLYVLYLNLAMGAATLMTVPLSNRFGDLKVFVIATLLSVACLVTLVYTTDQQLAAVLFVCRGMFANMTSPILSARVLAYIDPSVRATGSALTTNIRWLGWVIFSPISGDLIETYDYQIPFIITSMLYIVATTLFIIVNLRLPNLEEIRISQGTPRDPLYPVLHNWKNS